MIMGDIYPAYGKPEEKQENNAQTVVWVTKTKAGFILCSSGRVVF